MSALSASIRRQLDELHSRLSGSGPARHMWRELMSERDRRQMQRLVEKEGYDPRFDEIAGVNLPQIDVEMNDGVAGRRVLSVLSALGRSPNLDEAEGNPTTRCDC